MNLNCILEKSNYIIVHIGQIDPMLKDDGSTFYSSALYILVNVSADRPRVSGLLGTYGSRLL